MSRPDLAPDDEALAEERRRREMAAANRVALFQTKCYLKHQLREAKAAVRAGRLRKDVARADVAKFEAELRALEETTEERRLKDGF